MKNEAGTQSIHQSTHQLTSSPRYIQPTRNGNKTEKNEAETQSIYQLSSKRLSPALRHSPQAEKRKQNANSLPRPVSVYQGLDHTRGGTRTNGSTSRYHDLNWRLGRYIYSVITWRRECVLLCLLQTHLQLRSPEKLLRGVALAGSRLPW